MQTYFNALADCLQSMVVGGERFKCWFSGESTDFVRFNQGKVRQPGHVRQLSLSLNLVNGLRHATADLSLAGDMASDRALLERALEGLRLQLPELPDDPHFLMAAEVNSTTHCVPSRLPPAGVIVGEVLETVAGYDFVGILACGPVYRGFANSHGQRNWHETASFDLDFSLYQSKDKAVKTAYAGFDWDGATFRARFAAATAQLEVLKRPPVSVPPGAYRAYLTPTALNEILGMLNWDGLSEKSLRTKQSSLRRMRDEGVTLAAAITLSENTLDGLAPGFQGDGFIKPERVVLIENGRLADSMVSPRTAMEYGIGANGADGGEALSSLDLAGGNLPLAEVLAELGTGIYISNLWYTNFSDRSSCRMTGMTRFATFWVENGEIKAPLNVMRFDDSLFRLLGDNLLGLTRERELLIDNDSYGGRGTSSSRLPGALVKDFTFVL